MIKFSVIIPFKKESNYLKKNLNALNQIKDNNLFEVILLPDEDFEIFEQYNFTFSIIPTGKISPPRKRDIGVKNSVSQYIYFIDDDAYRVQQQIRFMTGVIFDLKGKQDQKFHNEYDEKGALLHSRTAHADGTIIDG